MKTLILGDIHGVWRNAESIIESVMEDHPDILRIIQVGDMGFGFPGAVPWKTPYPLECLWVDGNHENFDMLSKRHLANFGQDPYHTYRPAEWMGFLQRWTYLPRGSVRDGILFVGGASSIDKMYRTVGLDWWGEENISYSDQERVLDAIDKHQGTIHTVISHDCPTSFVMAPVLFGPEYHDGNRRFLEEVRKRVRPKRWYFGHYHAKFSGHVEGCDWRCINMASSGDYVIVDLL
jgi:hypothetical protein